MKLLALDTASGLCSAALYMDGEVMLRETPTTREHARLVLPMVQSLLAEAGIALSALDAIAFGRGPGSFTGLRIAASVTQGLAFGAGLPVLPVSDLRALAQQVAVLAPAGTPLLACMDARMHELYWALYEAPLADQWVSDTAEQLCTPVQLTQRLGVAAAGSAQWRGAGMGLAVWLASEAAPPLNPALLLPAAEPSAREIALLGAVDWSAGKAQPPEAAVPVYLRDDVARPSAQ